MFSCLYLKRLDLFFYCDHSIMSPIESTRLNLTANFEGSLEGENKPENIRVTRVGREGTRRAVAYVPRPLLVPCLQLPVDDTFFFPLWMGCLHPLPLSFNLSYPTTPCRAYRWAKGAHTRTIIKYKSWISLELWYI